MGVDLFKLGIAFILLALMFPLVEAVSRYVSDETAAVSLVLWLLGVLLLFISAFVTFPSHSNRGETPSP